MKKIVGVSLWIWGGIVLVVAGATWFGAGKLTHHPEEQAKVCYYATKALLVSELEIAFARKDLATSRTRFVKLGGPSSAEIGKNLESVPGYGEHLEREESDAALDFARDERAVKTKLQAMQKPQRFYDKAMSRLKEKEFLTRRYSTALEKWLDDGRVLFSKKLKNEKDAEKWDIFMEQDLTDLIRQ